MTPGISFKTPFGLNICIGLDQIFRAKIMNMQHSQYFKMVTDVLTISFAGYNERKSK